MPVPELNTQGIDIGNTLLKIEQMKRGVVQDEHYELQNALLKRKLSPESLANENALAVLQRKKEQIEADKELLAHAAGGLPWVKANIENGNINAYTDYRNHMVNDMGMNERLIPNPETFFDSAPDPTVEGGVSQTFNKNRFNDWSNRAAMTAKDIVANGFDPEGKRYEMKILYGPGDKTMMLPIKKGEKYTPEAGWTLEKPQYESEKWGSEQQFMKYATSPVGKYPSNPEGMGLTPAQASEKWLNMKAKYTKEGKIVMPQMQYSSSGMVDESGQPLIINRATGDLEAAPVKVGVKPSGKKDTLEERLNKRRAGRGAPATSTVGSAPGGYKFENGKLIPN